MSSAGIFIYGVVVFAVVAVACGLIAYGIVTERRDRRALEAEQADAAADGRANASVDEATRAVPAS